MAGNVPTKSRCWASPGGNARDPPSLPLHRIPAWSWGATAALVAQGLRQALGAEGEELRLQQQLLRCWSIDKGSGGTRALCVRFPLRCLWMWIPMSRQTRATRPGAEAPRSCPGSQARPRVHLGALRSRGRSPFPVLPLSMGDDGVESMEERPGKAGRTKSHCELKRWHRGTWSPSKVAKIGRNPHLIWFICYNDSSPWAILNTSVIFASKTLLQGL